MAIPNLQYRGDIIVMAAFDEASPNTMANWCGATSISLSISNAMQEQTIGDCDDWSLPPQVVRAYGAQSVNATVNATLTRTGRDALIRMVHAQREVPIRFHLVDAAAGQIEYIDGTGMFPDLTVDNIGNVDGAAITYTLNIQFKAGVELVNA